MPCNSEHMAANTYEKQLSQVACLLDELSGIPFSRSDWAGYHPRVYNRTRNTKEGDQMVRELCSRLQGRDVSQYSLEMQIWWRDHQHADRERVQKEIASAKASEDREKALAKLTPYERSLLSLK